MCPLFTAALTGWTWVTHLSFPSWPAGCRPRLGTREQQPRCRRFRDPGSSGRWWWCLLTPPPVQQNGKTSISMTTTRSNRVDSPLAWSHQSCFDHENCLGALTLSPFVLLLLVELCRRPCRCGHFPPLDPSGPSDCWRSGRSPAGSSRRPKDLRGRICDSQNYRLNAELL